MTEKENNLKDFAVQITYRKNYGSGVLFSCAGKVLILTAFHVLERESELDLSSLHMKRMINGTENNFKYSFIRMEYDNSEDIAVIEVTTDEKVPLLKLNQLEVGKKAVLCGFPALLANNNNKVMLLDVTLKDFTNDYEVMFTVDDALGSTTLTEIETLEGFSGGGFFSTTNNIVCLCGIETKVLLKNVPYKAICGASIAAISRLISQLGVSINELQHKESITDIVRKSVFYMYELVPLRDFSSKLKEQSLLVQEYQEGIDAHPDHIRNNLDIRRERWINKISECYKMSSVVVIRGASGQGKTSLAYRYLIDYYDEDQVIVIREIDSKDTIRKILQFFKSHLENQKIIIYYDVHPGEDKWVELLSKFNDFLGDIKVLVTIREEDFNISEMSHNNFHYEELALDLSEDEARDIYSRYRLNEFISFGNVWDKFGSGGPLLEFIYLLNHSESLEEKIDRQVRKIESEDDEEAWFSILAIIALAGKYDISIQVDRLYEVVDKNKCNKLLRRFEKELFIKISKEGNSVKGLHAVRSNLILKALEKNYCFDYSESLIKTLSIINYGTVKLVIEYIYQYGINQAMINKLGNIRFRNLSVIEIVFRSLLWYAVFDYQEKNKEAISLGNTILNNNYLMLAIGDTTGFIDYTDSRTSLLELLDKQMPGTLLKVKKIVDSQEQRYLSYDYASMFMRLMGQQIKFMIEDSGANSDSAGYLLFWAAKLGINIKIDKIGNIERLIDSNVIVSLVKGLTEQNLIELADEVRRNYLVSVLQKENVLSFYLKDNEIFSNIIVDPGNNKPESNNDLCMKVVYTLNGLFPNLKRYNVQILGLSKVGDISIPDTEKHIPIANIPEKWITELNNIGIGLQQFRNSPKDWKEVFDNIIDYRISIVSAFTELLNVLTLYYKKGILETGNLSKLMQNVQRQKGFEIPQCSLDIYGIKNDSEYLKKKFITKTEGNFDGENIENEPEWIGNICNQYFNGISNFISQLPGFLYNIKNPKNYEKNVLVYNILKAYEDYDKFTKSFESFFSKYCIEIDQKKELDTLEKTVAFVQWVCENGNCFFKDAAYKSYELFKQKKRAVNDFLENPIKTLRLENKIEKNDKCLDIYIDFAHYDAALGEIYYKIKKIVGIRHELSPARSYLLNKVDLLCLVFSTDGYCSYQKVYISVKKVIIADNLEQLKAYMLSSNRNAEVLPHSQILLSSLFEISFILNQCIKGNEVLLTEKTNILLGTVEKINMAYKNTIPAIAEVIPNRSDCIEIKKELQQLQDFPILVTNLDEYYSIRGRLEKIFRDLLDLPECKGMNSSL